MKKAMSLIIAIILAAGCLAACGSAEGRSGGDAASGTGGSSTEDAGKLRIVTTIFPEYDWMLNILGDNSGGADVTLLLANGVDLHSFQPSAADILKISACDLFIYVGGESDRWVADALQEAVNQDMIVINLLEVLGDAAKEEEVVEGMQDDEHEHGDDGQEGGPEDAPEYDEHVWLSLRNAVLYVDSFTAALQQLDPDNAAEYRKNADAYIEKLSALDAEYQTAVDNARVSTVLFGDRFPFRYLTDDYGLTYYAAFAGCSAETEASFETITFLSRKVDELGLRAVMTIEGKDHRIAETIVQNTQAKDQQILTMDSMQATTLKDMANGTTYLSIMESNLAVLQEALR
ncbi:MAG: zinc ABC transporter substrate-binding protein [Firmicutes bacterium]|nr:zinc ABC transporter substrate-binding protein [Bacillota bacterium]